VSVLDETAFGARWDEYGVHVSVYSARATAIDLCTFADAAAPTESRRLPMQRTGDVWSITVPGAGPGLIYGLRATGPWAPESGHWFDHARHLFDPYGRAFAETFDWARGRAPRAVVIDPAFDWRDDRRPGTPWRDTLLYEAHVKGFTAQHPDIPSAIRGTYAGLAHPAAIRHLQSLGVTAVELLPVHARVDERELHNRQLTNYWGYNTLGFFAPEPRLAAADTPQGVVDEFKTMVRALHAAGLEVILDVVYNHTAEGAHIGSTMCWRGLDNAAYYRLRADDPSRYEDLSGCGNTLDLRKPAARRLVLDSLRYWVEDMRVDGFRFDLASALVRGDHGVDMHCAFLTELHADPVLAGVKLIAEPWDATGDGYRVGGFPPGWVEWNGRYRDDVRRYWTGAGTRAALVTRLAGSSDLYGTPGRGPLAGINFVTSHDGFTLADLVSYARKHNDANGENNRDGDNHNFSANHGIEGPTADPDVHARRRRHQRGLLTTLFSSVGVPMINGGDEVGRSQGGNNNAYCHDSPVTWTPWTVDQGADLDLLRFVQNLADWRQRQDAIRRDTFFEPTDAHVQWLRLDGAPMTNADWHAPDQRGVIMRLAGPPPVDIIFDGHAARLRD
jgi:glycogen operon protein